MYATAVTIGCRLNQADTALVFDVLKNMGFEIVPQKTDKVLSLILINTCSVTASASQKSRQAARSMKKKYPNSFVIVTGCSIETEKETWSKESEIDLFIPNSKKTEIASYLKKNKKFNNLFNKENYELRMTNDEKEVETQYFASDKENTEHSMLNSEKKEKVQENYELRMTNYDKDYDKDKDKDYDNDNDNDNDKDYDKDKEHRLKDDNIGFKIDNTTGYYPFKCRANLKIQEGCDSFCTYCIVPYGRGKPRSRDLDDTIREFKELLKRKHKEIILTGVNIAMYSNNNKSLVNLLEELIKIPGDFRIRLSSTEPQFNNHGLIDIIASTDKICRFLHLPLQHGSNEILKKMGRNYTTEEFSEFVNEAVSKIPNICIGTDIITGFPGETDKLFNQSKNFVKNLPLAYMHVFKYSKRIGTPAAEYKDQIPNITSSVRHKELSAISAGLDQSYLNKQIDCNLPVLFERQNANGDYIGWSDNYVKVKLPQENYNFPEYNTSNKDIINRIINTKIVNISGNREISGIVQ